MEIINLSNIRHILIFCMSLLLIACGGGEADIPQVGNQNSNPAIIIDEPTAPIIDVPSDPIISDGSSINVVQECSDTGIDVVRIAWDVPTTYNNNDPLEFSNITSYRIYYGTESRNYPYYVSINDPSLLRCALSDLGSGTFYLTMTTVLGDGTESDYSNELSITI